MIDLQPSLDQQQIIDSVSGYLQRDYPVDRFQPNKRANAAKALRDGWAGLAQQGFFALAAAEDAGGAGFTMVEEMLAHREFGRSLMSPSLLATTMAVHLAHEAGKPDLLEPLIGGERQVALCNGIGPANIGPACDGTLHLIDSEPGDLLLLPGTEGFALVERNDIDDIQAVTSLDASVALHRGQAKAAPATAFVSSSSTGLTERYALLVTAALVGMAEAARDLAVEHAGVREQFGKLIGSFQGVAHHCADMELRARAARAQTSFAAITLRDGQPNGPFHVNAAMIVAANAAIQNATMAIRVLGAMGFTAECPLHLYLKRSHVYERLCGGTRNRQRELLRLTS